MDLRHSYYSNLYFIGYSDDRYRIYLQEKDDADYYSQSIVKYKINHWNKCTDNICPVHLIDKRYY